MKPGTPEEDWSAANQRVLMAELAGLSRRLRGEPNESETTAPAPGSPALDALCAMFRLSGFERQVLLLCAGMELDGGFAAQCAAAPGSGGNPWPSFGLALAALPEPHWDALGNRAPLRHWRLLETIGHGPLVASRLQIDERILFFLTGVRQLDERLVSLIEPVQESGGISPTQRPLLERLSGAWQAAFDAKRSLPALQLCGADLSAKRTLAAALTNILTIQLFRLPVAALPTSLAELENLQRLWEREAILENAALLLECDRSDEAETARELVIARWIELTRTPLLISTREPRRDLERSLLTIEVPKPTRAEQRRAWEEAMGAKSLNGQLDRVVAQFDFSTAAIRTTATGLLGEAAEPQLWDACRLQARPRLQNLAQRITSNTSWADIVLPPAQLNILQTIAQHLRQRTRVYDDWGFAEQSNRGLGLSALFTGPSGTGKTLAAEILANELQLDLFRIDLSAVVSKYIGETEKNLRRVFDAAEEGGAVLLFDEADALFGKRSEVKDSHDRYANVEISYLLQRMEAYRGLAILTTNMKEALDPAFLRRLRFIVQFPFPDQAQRAEIWRRIFPAKTPTDSLEIEKLARMAISGGNIRSIALNAAFAAADANEPVRMPHLLGAARLEYEKLEKPLTEAELGGWR
jgi:ATPase family associated with various cellular activities (AAA)/Winged helix domain, variant